MVGGLTTDTTPLNAQCTTWSVGQTSVACKPDLVGIQYFACDEGRTTALFYTRANVTTHGGVLERCGV